jgi:hypothetical protein
MNGKCAPFLAGARLKRLPLGDDASIERASTRVKMPANARDRAGSDHPALFVFAANFGFRF